MSLSSYSGLTCKNDDDGLYFYLFISRFENTKKQFLYLFPGLHYNHSIDKMYNYEIDIMANNKNVCWEKKYLVQNIYTRYSVPPRRNDNHGQPWSARVLEVNHVLTWSTLFLPVLTYMYLNLKNSNIANMNIYKLNN